jgi:2-oxoglutarate ferredoxin oxidoreductase subunit delta
MEAVKRVVFNEERCKGCELCTVVCPKEIIKMAERINSHGYHPAEVVDQDKCISCGICAQMCPDVVIKVYRPDKR